MTDSDSGPKWSFAEMKNHHVLLSLLISVVGCAQQLPHEQWHLLNRLSDQLRDNELGVYLPEQDRRHQAEMKQLGRALELLRPPLTPRAARVFSETVAGQIARSETRLHQLSCLKEQLQQDQDRMVRFLADDFNEMEGYRHYPELNPLVTELHQTVADLKEFQEPGTYYRNLDLVKQVGRLYEDLRLRWISYSGGLRSPSQIDLEIARYGEQLFSLLPQQPYVVIDTALNRLYVKIRDEIVLEAVCSTGSGHTFLASERRWEFATPRGEFEVLRKIKSPSWRKPDWAFLELGEGIPTRESDRVEYGSLGEYAFEFAKGYFIHGTLYTRLLGKPVTHGCIRLGEKDLERLASLISVGNRIFII